MPTDVASHDRHDLDNGRNGDHHRRHRRGSDTLSTASTVSLSHAPSPSLSPSTSRSPSPAPAPAPAPATVPALSLFSSRPQRRVRARDAYCCGLLAPVDVESTCTSPAHSPSDSLPHRPHHHLSGIGPGTTFWTTPVLGPLLFPNESSDARDHAANERTFLSYLRLSIYMAVVSVAITLSFHLKSQPTDVELRMARPLGLIFWLLAVACLAMGFGNYINTVNKYSRKAAIVQTGWRTQAVMILIGLSIVATCIVLLVVAQIKVDLECDSLSRAASALLFPSSSPGSAPSLSSAASTLNSSSSSSSSPARNLVLSFSPLGARAYTAADVICAEKLKNLPFSIWSSVMR